MSEQPQSQPLTHDQLASQDDFTVELRKEHGARYNQMGQFVLESAQVDALYEQHLGVPNTVNPSVEEQQQASATSPESETMSPERVKEILQKSQYGLGLRIRGGYDGVFNGAASRKLHPAIAEELFNRFDAFTTAETKEQDKAFNEAGVSEVMTIARANDIAAAEGWRSQGRYPDNIFLIQYRTAGTESFETAKYPYQPGGDKRGGQYFKYTVALPEERAKAVWGALQQNPELVRELGDMMVLSPNSQRFDSIPNTPGQGVMSNQEWNDSYRPPYEQWRETNGGINRIAFRTAVDQGPEQSQIIEF